MFVIIMMAGQFARKQQVLPRQVFYHRVLRIRSVIARLQFDVTLPPDVCKTYFHHLRLLDFRSRIKRLVKTFITHT